MLPRSITSSKGEADRIMAWLAGPRSAAALGCVTLMLMLKTGKDLYKHMTCLQHNVCPHPGCKLKRRGTDMSGLTRLHLLQGLQHMTS